MSGNDFLPEQAVTAAEAQIMINDAKSVIANDEIDEDYNSIYEFEDGVIVIPEDVHAVIDSDYTVTVTDYESGISAGDTFVVYSSGYPVALNAINVDTLDNVTVISAYKNEEAVTAADAEGSIDINLENFEANELSTYSITNTETYENEEMTVELYSISYDKDSKTLTASQRISVGSAAAGTVTVKLKNLKLDHKESLKTLSAKAIVTADTTVTTEISFDFGSYAGIPSSITLGAVPVAGVGSISLSMEYSLTGGVSMSWDGELKAGLSYDDGDLRLIKGYTKKGFSFTAEAQVRAGLRLSADVDLIFVKGNIYGTVGVKMSFTLNTFDSGVPKNCVTIKGYMYAQVGASVSVFGKSIPINPQDIFTESNSPVRVVYHYEDGVFVSSCTRGLSLKYTTSVSSGYFNPSPSYGQGSYGGGTSEPIIIWEYNVDNAGNAAITKYSGNASAVAVPSKIDGHTVTKIDRSAFYGNTALRSVTMPSTVTVIGSGAFSGCTNLSNVSLPSNLIELENNVFNGCSSLTEIFIPKTLKDGWQAFNNSGIETVEFEYGMTVIPDYIFYKAAKLKNIIMPETVITIDTMAFSDCTSLETIELPQYITVIGTGVFSGCTNLSNVGLPPNITTLGSSAFSSCTNLSSISLPGSVKSMGTSLFSGCSSLTEIFIPKSVEDGWSAFDNSGIVTAELEYGMTVIPNGIFSGADNLKNVIIPETVTTIDNSAFADCTALETIELPQYLTNIGTGVFTGCTNLSSISLPDSITSMGASIFNGCTSLEKVKLPNTAAKVESSTFSGCSALTDIVLPSSVTAIGLNAFLNCSSLSSIVIPERVTAIYDSAFKGCTALQSVVLQYGLESIGSEAFYECNALSSVSIPDSVTLLGSQSFYGCDSLSDVSFGIGLKEIPDSAFRQCQALQEVILPRYCTKVAANAFAEDIKLTKVTAFMSVAVLKTIHFHIRHR